MRLSRLVSFVAVALGAVVYVALLPPPVVESASFTPRTQWPVVKGAYHVHSERSDGTGTSDDIAAAAARAGLQFVILTDHGNGTRPPQPPAYRAGVLCIDAVEVSTTLGHVTALGLPQMPYRLAGRPSDVIEDVRRVGGIAIAAHPGSPKPELQWRDWEAPFNGLEWLNADSEWRDESWAPLTRALLTYAVRPAEAIAALLDRPSGVIEQWDRILRTRHVVGIAGADAHARLGFGDTAEPFGGRVIARVPSYEASFRAFANHLVLNAPLTGDAALDAQAVLDAIRYGHVVTSIEGFAALTGFDATAEGSGRVARVGEYIDSASGVTFHVRFGAPAGTRVVLVRDGVAMYETDGPDMITGVGADPAVYRFEAYLPGHDASSVPWVITNPIYVNLRAAHRRPSRSEAAEIAERLSVPTHEWQAESSLGSASALSQGQLDDGTPVSTWQLRVDGDPASAFAAVSFPVSTTLAQGRGLQLRGRATRPLRISAQLRTRGELGERRWSRYFYLDERMRTVLLPFDEFHPVSMTAAGGSAHPPMSEVDSLLFVADTLNTVPGTAATVSFSELWLVR